MAIGEGSSPQYIYTASNNTNTATIGSLYLNSTSNQMYVGNGTQWQPLTTYTTTAATTFTWNGDPNVALTGSRIFQSMEERVEYQQQAYQEPRDHAYNPDSFGTCSDCKPHNLHRHSADKHLFIIDEEIPWSDRLAS